MRQYLSSIKKIILVHVDDRLETTIAYMITLSASIHKQLIVTSMIIGKCSFYRIEPLVHIERRL